MNISGVVITKNEEKNIVDCLESLFWCDEIIVVDDESVDRTVEIIDSLKNKKIKVFTNKLEDFSHQRNFGLSKAKNEWVLFVDADERISPLLKEEILSIKDQALRRCNGFYIKRSDWMWGKELKFGEFKNINLLRLAKKNSGVWRGKVHEEWIIRGKTGRLMNPIVHYPHQSITEFLKEINTYTDIRAKELFDKNKKTSGFNIVFYPFGKFINNYVIKKGFKDGIEGFIVSVLMSFHSFLVRGKLWLLINGKK